MDLLLNYSDLLVDAFAGEAEVVVVNVCAQLEGEVLAPFVQVERSVGQDNLVDLKQFLFLDHVLKFTHLFCTKIYLLQFSYLQL